MEAQEGHTEGVALLESLMHLRGTYVLSRVTQIESPSNVFLPFVLMKKLRH